MTTIIINERTKLGKLILGMIKETKCGEIVDFKKEIPNKETSRAILDAKNGKTKKYENTDALFNDLGI